MNFHVSPNNLIFVWIVLMISYVMAAFCIGKLSEHSSGGQNTNSPDGQKKSHTICAFIGAILIILGSKLSLIHYYGSDLPFWDQWDVEPELLYIPYDKGELLWNTLFAPHNEHRLFFSRLWALSLYAINQQWDARLQTVANALLHTFFGLWLVWILWKINHKKELWIILGVVSLILTVPSSWENTLFGFQSSFYFLLGFSSMAILLIPQNQPFSLSWLLGIFFALLSLFTMGSGISATVVVILLIVILAFRERQMTWRDGVSLLSCLLILLAGIFMIHVHEGHAGLRAKSFSDFIMTLGKSLSWPWIDVPFLFPLLWMPFFILCLRIVMSGKKNGSKYPFFIMGLGLWILLQCLAMAYSRGFEGAGPASRYMDLLSLIPVVNVLAAYDLYRHSRVNFQRRKDFRIAYSCWYAFFLIGFLNILINGSIKGFTHTGTLLSKQSETVRHYLATEDDNVILKAKHMEIPYPDAVRLSSLLKDEEIRAILPASVRKTLVVVPSLEERNEFVRNGFYPAVPVIKDKSVWGSFDPLKGDQQTGHFKSERIAPPRLPYLRFQIAGYLDNVKLKIELYNMDHQLIEAIVPDTLPKESWRSVDVPSPRHPFYIKATDQAAQDHGGWFAFTEPMEIGRFSRISESISSAGRTLLVMGLAFVIALVVYTNLEKKEDPPYSE